MAKNHDFGKIYSATYSNVPVYEFNVGGNHVMRRRSDDWINATHILKVADYDKPARTRILEREVQKGVHEKVQGGYGKYQGTWIPLGDGEELAAKNGVLAKLQPIFDFVPGDRSPPPAPKHATAASTKPRAPRASAQPKRLPARQQVQPKYDQMDVDMRGDRTPDDITVASESAYDDYEAQYGVSRKRRRVEDRMSQADREHRLWADELLDYFVLQDSPLDSLPSAPIPPDGADLDRPIDEKGYTALHWAAAMGDIEVCRDLIHRGASIDAQSKNGETPLMRATVFTNCYDKMTMDKLAPMLLRTVNMQEWYGNTVFHHIACTTERKSKYACARYYMDSLLNCMSEMLSPGQIEKILNTQDQSGDTAITIAARYGARKCVRSLIGRHAAVDIPNHQGQTADQLIVQLNHRRQERISDGGANRQMSSSPFQAESNQHNHTSGGAVRLPISNLDGNAFDPHVLHNSINGVSVNGSGPSVYKSEAALTLTSQIVPVLFGKAQDLAKHLEEELAEKDAELAEAERVVAIRRAERDSLRRQQEDMKRKEMEQMDGRSDSDEILQKQLEDLERECQGLTEAEEAYALSKLMEEEQALSSPLDDTPLVNGTSATEQVRTKFVMGRQLLEFHRRRRDAIADLVKALSVAGLGNNQEQYKRLVTGALGVREEDVESMLPDIVEELEQWRGLESAGA